MSAFISTASLQGGRNYQEDALSVNSLPHALHDPEKYLEDMFRAADALCPDQQCGASATVAVVRDGRLSIGNVGDSPAVLFIYDEQEDTVTAQQLTRDHNVSDPDERRMIEARGGRVSSPGGVWRINNAADIPRLALSRSLGDKECPGIDATPDIVSQDIAQWTGPHKRAFLSVASDGVGAGLSLEEQAEIVRQAIHDGKENDVADRLAAASLENGSRDNISAAFIQLRPTTNAAIGIFDGHGGSTVANRLADFVSGYVRSTMQPAPHAGAEGPDRGGERPGKDHVRMFRVHAGRPEAGEMQTPTQLMTRQRAGQVLASAALWRGAEDEEGNPIMRVGLDGLSDWQQGRIREALQEVGITPRDTKSKSLGPALRVSGKQDVGKLMSVLDEQGALAFQDLSALPQETKNQYPDPSVLYARDRGAALEDLVISVTGTWHGAETTNDVPIMRMPMAGLSDWQVARLKDALHISDIKATEKKSSSLGPTLRVTGEDNVRRLMGILGRTGALEHQDLSALPGRLRPDNADTKIIPPQPGSSPHR